MFLEKFKALDISHRTLFKASFVKLFAVLLLSLIICTTAQAAGEVHPTFYTGVQKTRNEGGYALAVQPDGKIPVGGFFTVVNGTAHNGLVRFNADG